MGPLFFHRAARDLVGRLNRQRARFAAIPHAMAWGMRGADTWAARGEHHQHLVRAQGPAGTSQCFWRSGGVPEGLKLVPPRAQ